MNRRNFLQTASCVTALPAFGFSFKAGESPAKNCFKGFIVSDAHFGWNNKEQPDPKDQIAAMQNIMARFPDLDVMFDTGDAHHGGLDDDAGAAARANWTDIIAGITGPVPFMYVPGNHELMGWGTKCDPEWRCNQLGSLCCRPYYSFDYKGVHFISVPEMMMAVYVTRETIEWLKLDLMLNRDKTVILLSHNNISGTTGPDEEGYRGLVNSSELMGIMRENPNIIAWMHGHNHNFQMIKMENKLFVSNGRIGGFDPSKGKHGIGGIYFEISSDGIKVLSYSATLDRFLKESDGPEVSVQLAVPTTYNPSGAFNYNYGTGGARDGERIPVINHFAGGGDRDRLFISGAETPMISENPDMSYYKFRNNQNGHMQLFGFIVRDNKELWRWDNPGIVLLKRDDGKDIKVTAPHHGAGRCSYYRCPPGRKYKITIEVEPAAAGPVLEMQGLWGDRNGETLTTWSLPRVTLAAGRQTKEFELDAAAPKNVNTIYTDIHEDNTLNFTAQAAFYQMTADVKIHLFKIEMVDAGSNGTVNPSIRAGSAMVQHNGTLDSATAAEYPLPAFKTGRQVIEAAAGGSKRLHWLIRREGLDWQVRNAAMIDHGTHIEITGFRNLWTNEVCFAPLFPCSELFVSRLSGISEAKIYPLNRGNAELKIEVGGTVPEKPAFIEIPAAGKPSAVTGASAWEFKKGIVKISVSAGSSIVVQA